MKPTLFCSSVGSSVYPNSAHLDPRTFPIAKSSLFVLFFTFMILLFLFFWEHHLELLLDDLDLGMWNLPTIFPIQRPSDRFPIKLEPRRLHRNDQRIVFNIALGDTGDDRIELAQIHRLPNENPLQQAIFQIVATFRKRVHPPNITRTRNLTI